MFAAVVRIVIRLAARETRRTRHVPCLAHDFHTVYHKRLMTRVKTHKKYPSKALRADTRHSDAAFTFVVISVWEVLWRSPCTPVWMLLLGALRRQKRGKAEAWVRTERQGRELLGEGL